MHRILYTHDKRSIAVLHGLGGMGKTQLAITYLTDYNSKYSAAFWINANDEDSIKLSFIVIARQIYKKHPSTNALASLDAEKDLQRTVDAVLSWLSLSNNTRWLLVYDNYDNPKVAGNKNPTAIDIRRFMPSCNHGSIIVTTRSSEVNVGSRLRIEKLHEVNEGLEILSNTSGRKECINGMALMVQISQ